MADANSLQAEVAALKKQNADYRDALAPFDTDGSGHIDEQELDSAKAYLQAKHRGGILISFFPKFMQARGRVRVGEEGYHLDPSLPPMAASQAFPECRYSYLPVVPLLPM